VSFGRTLPGVVAILGWATCVFAADLPEVERSLNNKLKDKVVTLRTFYSGSKLRFAADGTLQDQAQTCPWTLCSKLSISGVKLKDDRVLIRGERMMVYFEGKPLAVKYSHTRQPVEIEIASLSSEEQVTQAVSSIFVGPGTKLSELVPEYWKAIVCRLEENQPIVEKTADTKPGEPTGENRDIYRVGASVLAPRVKKAPDPEYPALAKALGREGTLLLWVVVRADGRIHDVRIARPLGLGFEEQAVVAVKSWEFEPAMKEGKPVAVQLNIEINFRLR
jgi:TonB family protein